VEAITEEEETEPPFGEGPLSSMDLAFIKTQKLRFEDQIEHFPIQFAVLHLQDMFRSVAFFP